MIRNWPDHEVDDTDSWLPPPWERDALDQFQELVTLLIAAAAMMALILVPGLALWQAVISW